MNYFRVLLKFQAPIHLSRDSRQAEQTRDFISADTLFSALFSSGIYLGMSPDELMQLFQQCRFSSAYPFHKSSFYFPRPFCKLPPIQGMENDPKAGKKVKKIQYLDQQNFEKLLAGKLDFISRDHLSASGKFISSTGEIPSIKKALHDRVHLDIENNESTPFSLENLYLHPESGLFFLVQTQELEFPSQIRSCLNLLADQGIGSDRNVGYGKFTVDSIEKIVFKDSIKSDYYLSLAPVFPSASMIPEMDNPHLGSSWKFKMSEGYISSPENENAYGLKRKKSLMITEGAVLYSSGQIPVGEIRDVRPEGNTIKHPIWREGRGFWLPIEILD
jgi:CRISPR type III-A-associated RAMP protein Csm4